MKAIIAFLSIGLLFSSLAQVSAQEKGQPNLLDLKQEKQDLGVVQRSQESLRPPSPALKGPVEPKSPQTVPVAKPVKKEEDKLARAWTLYRKGDFRQAIPLFLKEMESARGSKALEAGLGLAYSYQKQGNNQKASLLLEGLVQKKYKLPETLPQLISLLFLEGNYDKSEIYLAQLPADQRVAWGKKIQEGKIREQYRKKAPFTSAALTRFAEEHQEGLRSCLARDVFFKIAQELEKTGQRLQAGELYKKLLPCTDQDWQLRLGIFYGLANSLPWKDIDPLIHEERMKKTGPADYQARLTSLEFDILRRELAALSPSSPEVEGVARRLLALEPDDREARKALAWSYYSQGKNEAALRLFSSLHEQQPQEKDYALGLIYTQIRTGKTREAAAWIEGTDFPGKEWAEVKRQVYLKRAGEAYEQKNYAEAENYAGKVLTMDPDNSDAAQILAWSYYNQGKDEAALRLFSSLHKQQPQEKDYALGLVYTQMRTGKTREAAAWIEGTDFPGKEWAGVKRQVYLKRAGEAYDQKNYAEAENYAGKVLTLDPDNSDAAQILAWSKIGRGRPAEALPILLKENEKSPSPKRSQDILSIYESMGERKKSFQMAESLRKEEAAEYRRIAADFFYRNDAPVTAAQTCRDPEACYANAAQPSMEASVNYRHKTGDAGLSRLTELSFPITGDYPALYGNKWTFSLIPTHLDSGTAGTFPYAGNYHKFLDGGVKTDHLETSLWLNKPELGFQSEGPIRYGFLLGSSFLNAPVSPMVTFSAGMAGKNWTLRADQDQVNESILSYAGQKDPYSGENWGRVLKSGLEGKITLDPWPHYWLTLEAGYGYLWGQNVWSNQSLFGNISFGRTIPLDPGSLSAGIFGTVKHFERNSNFFTFGHGGYFSPQQFYMVGPTLQFKTPPCLTYSVDTQISAGYLYYSNQGSPHYPLFKDSLASLNDPARNDVLGSYSGESKSKLGINGRIRLKRLFGNRVIGSVYLAADNSSSYTEWQAGIGLDYFFDSITNTEEFKHFLRKDPPR